MAALPDSEIVEILVQAARADQYSASVIAKRVCEVIVAAGAATPFALESVAGALLPSRKRGGASLIDCARSDPVARERFPRLISSGTRRARHAFVHNRRRYGDVGYAADQEEAGGPPTVDAGLEGASKECRRRIAKVLRLLPMSLAVVLYLQFAWGQGLREVAKRLRISYAAAQMRRSRGLRLLAKNEAAVALLGTAA